ncbi:ATP-binding domain-containing protein [Agrobacterium sp. 22117]|uniref:ATP-binding domain-containing protein n=1 Tax=Agrobacterium sp. 22117 TaxID=3453880 RepID=UPI003F843B17
MSEHEAQIEAVANESLESFAMISGTARDHLEAARAPSIQIADNSWTNPNADQYRRRIDQENAETHRLLIEEPAIARVRVTDEDGATTDYYICRTSPVPLTNKGIKLASYRSPVGRLASLPVGSDHTIFRDGRPVTVEVVESARFQPRVVDGEWDAHNAVVAGSDYGPLSIESFRRWLERIQPDVDASVLDALLEEEKAAAISRAGLHRSVITRMDLRDQPLLDQYQDEIFRLPLNSRLLLLGAPGTGKTTTLIKRLGQKLDIAFLEEDERRAIGATSPSRESDYARDWIMFTPTELLKLYVKEAFNREEIPAPDDRISTWSDYREELARNTFPILRSTSNSSSYVLKDNALTLRPGSQDDAITWFEDFDQWQRAAFWDEMRSSAAALSEQAAPDVAQVGARLSSAIGPQGSESTQVFVSLLPIAEDIRAMVEARKAATDTELKKSLNLQVNRDRGFLDSFGAFIEGLSDVPDDADDQEEDEEETNQPRVGRAAAMNHYLRVLRTQARARARRRNVPKASRTGRIIDWLAGRMPADPDLQRIGESLVVQSALRWFVNPVRRYVDGVPQRYRRFRRIRQAEGLWFAPHGHAVTDLHPLEADLILLAMMRSSDELVRRARRLDTPENPAQRILTRMSELYRTQVLVDEATDFSPIQLACMSMLARPVSRSFFACGDFNQRVTAWGTRSLEQMKWVLPDIDNRYVSIAYRQSKKLHALARQLVALGGDSAAEVALSDFADNEGVSPVLGTGMSDLAETARWLANRIIEIEETVRELPSIAVLVNSEADVRPIADALGEVLLDNNIRVIPCPDGQVRGREGAVRVFNVEHIKGLEFEAVFFVGVDTLAANLPDLFDKYLYVGATRAASYLGLTCAQFLPDRVKHLEPLFEQKW